MGFKNTLILASLVLGMFLPACVLRKKIRYPVTVSFPLGFEANIKLDTDRNTHLQRADAEACKAVFAGEMLQSMADAEKVKVVHADTAIADYVLVVKELTFTESVSNYTVQDTASDDNGKTYELHTVSAEAKMVLLNGKNGAIVKEIVSRASVEDKVTNRRTFWELLLKTNKEKTNYRYKPMSSSAKTEIAKKVGRRAWNAATFPIAKGKG